MNVVWSLLLLVIVVVGAVGYMITMLGEPTRRKLKARKVFFWVMVAPLAVIILLILWTRAERHGR